MNSLNHSSCGDAKIELFPGARNPDTTFMSWYGLTLAFVTWQSPNRHRTVVHSEIRTGPATSVNLSQNGQSDVTERKFGQQVFVEAYLLVNPVQIKVLMGKSLN